jgi:hypothetical protein
MLIPRTNGVHKGSKMTTYKTKEYEVTRKSNHQVFTHAVVFRNISGGSVSPEPNATFHISLKLAQKQWTQMVKTDWLVPLEIVEVEVA